MAKRTLVDLTTYKAIVKDFDLCLGSIEVADLKLSSHRLSRALEQRMLLKLQPYVDGLSIYLLGSYSRSEASLCSDIDMLVEGPPDKKNRLLKFMEQSGIAFRARELTDLGTLEDLDVSTFMSLLNIRPLNPSQGQTELDRITEGLEELVQKKRLRFVKELRDENQSRAKKYNSISNYLEPHLKFQPGGLRDLSQANLLLSFFTGDEPGDPELFNKLEYYKFVLLSVRQRLHALVATDVLMAPFQQDLAHAFGFEEPREFMSFLQNICSESSFLCRYLFERASLETSFTPLPVTSFDQLTEIALDREMRKKLIYIKPVRDFLESSPPDRDELLKHKRLPELKAEASLGPMSLTEFLYESKLFDFLIPDFSRVRCLVQHDQYHRYTVGAHSLVCLRNVDRLRKGKLKLFFLSSVLGEMTEEDWALMYYTALFHDLGKGLSEDHSVAGERIVNQYLKLFVSERAFVKKVSWLVKKHLLFSKTAFRANLSESSTYKALDDFNISDQLGRVLILFTLVDIASSNPEALTEWKESLLAEFYFKWADKESRGNSELMTVLAPLLSSRPQALMKSLDFDMLEFAGTEHSKLVATDYRALEDSESKFLCVPIGPSRHLVVYMSTYNEKGTLHLLMHFLSTLGLKIHKVNANSDETKILDLFIIEDKRDSELLLKYLEAFNLKENHGDYTYPQKTLWREMEDSTWVARWEGKDLVPNMLGLTKSLAEASLDIERLNIYKWGRQYELVIALSKSSVPREQWAHKAWDF